jgi:transposase
MSAPWARSASARDRTSGDTNKNDPNDARSVAVSAGRAKVPTEVAKEDHATVMRLWVRRRKDLASARTRVANQLHALLLELVPGGFAGQIYATKVATMLEGLQPTSTVVAARKELATELLGDLRRLDEQMKELRQRLADVVAASGTTTTKVFGVGPVIAAMVGGLTGDVRRFPSRAHPCSTADASPGWPHD